MVHLFGNTALEIIIDCAFGGEDYLRADELSGLWEKATAGIHQQIISDILLGQKVILHSFSTV